MQQVSKTGLIIIMGTAAPGMPDWPRSVAHHTTDPVFVK